MLKDLGRAAVCRHHDDEALKHSNSLLPFRSIIPALESSHALAHAIKIAPTMGKDKVLLVNLSGAATRI